MTKPKILEVVKQMLADWQEVYDSKDAEKVSDWKCDNGFCKQLRFTAYGMLIKDIIISELFKDVESACYNSKIWYPFFEYTLDFSNILSRINHLKRTIERLEKEIANENTTS